jgi:hypothetical protein
MKTEDNESGFEVGGMTLRKWIESIGISPTTAYRWLEKRIITPVNILGRHYITREEDQRLWARAKAGEFEKEVPSVIEKVQRQKRTQREPQTHSVPSRTDGPSQESVVAE